jgi:hypothetical protein
LGSITNDSPGCGWQVAGGEIYPSLATGRKIQWRINQDIDVVVIFVLFAKELAHAGDYSLVT